MECTEDSAFAIYAAKLCFRNNRCVHWIDRNFPEIRTYCLQTAVPVDGKGEKSLWAMRVYHTECQIHHLALHVSIMCSTLGPIYTGMVEIIRFRDLRSVH